MSSQFNFDEVAYNFNAAREILPYLISIVKPKSVLDVGCGLGTWLQVSKELGINEIYGIDNVEDNMLKIKNSEFKKVDLRAGFSLSKNFDLILCLEVAEHLPAKSSELFIKSVCEHGDVILFSAAIPGQGGQMHLNEQWPKYWVEKFERNGFYCYDVIRHRFWNNNKIEFWYRQNVLLFSRRILDVQSWSPSVNCNAYVHPNMFEHKISEIENLKWQLKLEKGTGVKKSFKKLLKSIKNKLNC